jgi:hypothetical protein
VASDMVDKEELERQFQGEKGSVSHRNNLVIVGINHRTGENETDVFEITEVEDTTETVMVLFATDIRTGAKFKMTFEELSTDGK